MMMIGTLLISAALGYMVFMDASDRKKEQRIFGRALGIAILAISLSLVAINLFKYASFCSSASTCPIKMLCPFKK